MKLNSKYKFNLNNSFGEQNLQKNMNFNNKNLNQERQVTNLA